MVPHPWPERGFMHVGDMFRDPYRPPQLEPGISFERTVDDPVPGLPIQSQSRCTRTGLPPLQHDRLRRRGNVTRKKTQSRKRKRRQRRRKIKAETKLMSEAALSPLSWERLDYAEVFDPGHTYLFVGSKGTKMSLKEWRHRSFITG